MKPELKQADGKTLYEPPRLAAISLRPEEAVLGACKNAGGHGTGQTGMTGPCEILLGGCLPLGS